LKRLAFIGFVCGRNQSDRHTNRTN
jgi:hypothetical protein